MAARPRPTRTRRATPKHGLALFHQRWADEYLRNGFNATQAYRHVKPHVTVETARVEASKYLATPSVRAYLDARVGAVFAKKAVDVDKILGRLVQDTEADTRRLYREDGTMLLPHEWPDDLANSIEGVETKADGSLKVRLVSKLGARRTLLEVKGKLRAQIQVEVTGADELLTRIQAKREALARAKRGE